MLSLTTSHWKVLLPHLHSSNASSVTLNSWPIIQRVAVGRRSWAGHGIAKLWSRLVACFTVTTDTESLSFTLCARSVCFANIVLWNVPSAQRANNSLGDFPSTGLHKAVALSFRALAGQSDVLRTACRCGAQAKRQTAFPWTVLWHRWY